MAVIKFSIPDAWVDENNSVYGVVEEPGSFAERQAIEAMNDSLGEGDYSGRIRWVSQCRQIWVEPETLLREQWNPDFISSEPINGWVHVLYANAEELG